RGCLLAFGRPLALAPSGCRGMAIGIPTGNEQTRAERIRNRGIAAIAASRHSATAAQLGAVHAVALRRSEARRQSAIVRERLSFAARAVTAVFFLQQTQLHHNGLNDGWLDFLPTATAQISRQN